MITFTEWFPELCEFCLRDGGAFPPNFQHFLATKLYVECECLVVGNGTGISVIKPSLVGLWLRPRTGDEKVRCFFLRHPFERQFVLTTSPSKRLNIETVLIPLDKEGLYFAVVTAFNFVSTPLDGAITEGDRINRFRRNMAHKRRPCVYSSVLNLALIDQGVGIGDPIIIAKLVKFAVFRPVKVIVFTDQGEILHGTTNHGSTLSCQNWP